MKKYITLILIIYSRGIFAQSFPDTLSLTDTIYTIESLPNFGFSNLTSEITFQCYDTSLNYIAVIIENNGKDTTVTIDGDTAKAIISLFKEWSKQIDMYNDMEREKEFWKEMYYRKSERLNQTLDGIHETNRPKDKPKKSKV